jgi:hypothetical protein
VIAANPFRTKAPISERGMKTYQAIARRLALFHPPLQIEKFIAQEEATKFSTLKSGDSTLDGIEFVADAPVGLARALREAKDQWGRPVLISMKEDPGHWALKASFGKTIGTGWREVWREAPFTPPSMAPELPGGLDAMLKVRFGTAGNPMSFSALHAAVDEKHGLSSIHIDEAGFMLALPKGVALTADFYGHLMNELLWKTEFRNWLSGRMDDGTARNVIREAIRRVSFNFISSANGFAGLDTKVKGIRGPRDAIFTAAKILAPVGVTVDVFDRDKYKVQVTGTALNGDLSATISIGGTW